MPEQKEDQAAVPVGAELAGPVLGQLQTVGCWSKYLAWVQFIDRVTGENGEYEESSGGSMTPKTVVQDVIGAMIELGLVHGRGRKMADGPIFEAGYNGFCAGCGSKIHGKTMLDKGTDVQFVEGELRIANCVTCAESARQDAMLTVEDVCPGCHQVRAKSGVCGCEE